jgi:hypothetical protein
MHKLILIPYVLALIFRVFIHIKQEEWYLLYQEPTLRQQLALAAATYK